MQDPVAASLFLVSAWKGNWLTPLESQGTSCLSHCLWRLFRMQGQALPHASLWNSCPLVSCFLQAPTQILSLDEDGPDLSFMWDTDLQQNKFLMYSTHLLYARPWTTCWGSSSKTQFLPSRISSPLGETQSQCYAMVWCSSVGAWRRCTGLTRVFNPGCNQGRLPGGSDIRAESWKKQGMKRRSWRIEIPRTSLK